MHLQNNTLLQGGKYRIVRYISSGGFGCTYEAEHVMLGERVAIKEFFVKDFCNRDEATAHVTIGTQSKLGLVEKLKGKFVEEAKMLYRMQHPGIVHVSDIFEENSTAYYVMNYINGSSLSEIVAAEGRLTEPRALKYIRQIAEALKYVHEHDCLHLDVKPGNIMVDNEGNAILIDFGASKQYDEVDGENTSTLLGMTPGYAPLEQIGNDVVKFTPATDIYSLGATLYKLLTGITPPSANLLASGEELGAFPERISETVRETVIKSMEINKNRRPQNIADFFNLLNGTSKCLPKAQIVPQQSNLNNNNEETQVITKSIGSIDSKDWKHYLDERHTIVNIVMFLMVLVSIAIIAYIIGTNGGNIFIFDLLCVQLPGILMCLSVIIGMWQLFNQKQRGYRMMVLSIPFINTVTPIYLLSGYGDTHYDFFWQSIYSEIFILDSIIAPIIGLIVLYRIFQIKHEGNSAWSLMEPAPAWMIKLSWVAWTIFGIATFASLP